MTAPVIEIVRFSRLRTLPVFFLFLGIAFAAAWAAWAHPEWNTRPSHHHSLLGVAIAGAGATYMFSFNAARAALGGPALYISGGRLVYLFPSHRSWPLSEVVGVGLQKVPVWGRIWLRVEFKSGRALVVNALHLTTSRQETLKRCAAAGLPMRATFAADGTTDAG